MRILAILLLCLWAAALPARAQDAANDDAGFLARQLQNALSGEGREVRVEGFEGALSARARIARITFADRDGVWLTIEDATMNWNRAALLRGAVRIRELTARQITVTRPPVPSDKAPPDAGAGGFALPQLPVAVEIGRIDAQRISLGQPVLGIAAELQLTGQLALVDQTALVNLRAERLDGPEGLISIAADFDQASDLLALEIVTREDAGGLIATMARIPGAPALDLTVTSQGPLSDFKADIALATDGAERLAGTVTLRQEVADIAAPGAPMEAAPGPHPWRVKASLAGDVGPLVATGYRPFFGDRAMLSLDALRAPDGALELDVFTLQTRAFYLDAAGALGADGFPENLLLRGLLRDLRGGPVRLPVAGAPVWLDAGLLRAEYDAARGDDWQIVLRTSGLRQGARSLDQLRLNGSGSLDRGDGPDGIGGLDGTISLVAEGIATGDAALDAAIGDQITAQAALGWAEANPLDIRDLAVTGADYGLTLSGQLAEPGAGGVFTGRAGVRAADLARLRSLVGRPLSGAATASATGRVELLAGAFDLDLTAAVSGLGTGDAALDGLIGPDARATASVRRDADGLMLDAFDLAAAGLSATGNAALSGPGSALVAEGAVTAAIADLSGLSGLAGRDLAGAANASAQGRAALDLSAFDLEATVTATGLSTGDADLDRIVGGDAQVAVSAARDGDTITLRRLDATAPGLSASAEGSATGPLDALVTDASVTAQIADLSGLSGLAGRPLAGSVDAAMTGAAVIDATRFDPLVTLGAEPFALDASLDAAGISTGDPALDRLVGGTGRVRIDATRQGDTLQIATLDVALAGLSASGTGTVTGPADAMVADGTLQARLDDLSTLNGLTGLSLAGSVAMQADGSAALDGSRFDLTAEASTTGLRTGIAAADAIAAGNGSLSLAATRAEEAIDIRDFTLQLPGLRATAKGTLSGGGGTVTLDARLADLGALVPQMAGPVSVSGTVAQAAGGALQLDIAGQGPGGIAANVAGSYDLAGNRADLRANGTATLELVDYIIGSPDLRLQGPVRFDLAVAGPPTLQSVSGQVTVAGGTIALPGVPLRLDNVTAQADVNGTTVRVQSGMAVAGGGRIDANGSLRIDTAAGIPASLQIAIRQAVLRQRGLYDVSLSGDIGIDGPLLGGANIAGRITLDRAELTVAAPPPGGGSFLDMRHVNETAPQRLTRIRAGLVSDGTGGAGGGGPVYGLDVTLSAPRQIFVRGRGLDAEFGGELRVGGTTAAPVPSGGFQLIRGRLNLLAKRLDLREARITLMGNLVPDIFVLAQSRSDNGVTVFVQIAGPASNPEITFRSDPELPEDEVLAELFFGRPISELSAFQVAQLTSAIAELAGLGGDGIVSKIRKATGIDDIDVETDSAGTTTARAGRYLSENVYTSIGVTGKGTTELQLNLDLSPSVTARGTVTTDSENTLGIFFERDY